MKSQKGIGLGFTILEILIVVSILALLALMITSVFSRFKKTTDLNRAAEDGASLLSEARAKTLSSQERSQYGVHFEPGRIVLFKGTSYTAGAPVESEFLLPSGVETQGIYLNGGGNEVVFTRLTGATVQYGAVVLRLSSDYSQTRTIRILGSGVVNIVPALGCDWAIFTEGPISIGGGSQIKSYDSRGGSTANQAVVKTNSTQANTLTLGSNATIHGDAVVGHLGDPNTVISLSGGAVITGARKSASEPGFRVPVPPPSLPDPQPSLPAVSPSGSPLIVPGGTSRTVNICQNVPSEIVTGSNVVLRLQGDCPLTLSRLSVGGGSRLEVQGDIKEISTDTFGIGSNVVMTFPGSLVITSPLISIGGGSSFVVNGALTTRSNSFGIGSNVPIQTQGKMTILTNSFSLGGGSSLSAPDTLTLTSQSIGLGSNVAIHTDGNVLFQTRSFSLGGGSNVRAKQDFTIQADLVGLGSNTSLSADKILDILANQASVGGGSSIKSRTDLPSNARLAIAGSQTTGFGSNTSFTGVLYAPNSSLSIGGGTSIKGSVTAKDAGLGSNTTIQQDRALLGSICISP